MEYSLRKYPIFAACGLNCGLCPRYYISGSSRCPGCAGEGFSEVHPPCGILSCCQRKGIEFCYLCEDYPCEKYNGIDASDSFITHKNQMRDMYKAKRIGIEAYIAEQNEKIKALEELLNNCDDGRRKSFFCLAVNLLDVQDVANIMHRITGEIKGEMPLKEKAVNAVRFFEETARIRGVSLKLRKT
ncbi:MAG: DUF3795 domain-containing protein [Treponema sp.]|jgi:hypothetical protein|nr:DUF3795 domain-containing protein [Treponema sp.]